MKKVFVVISDENYLSHAGSLFINALNEGKWDGDLCLITNNINDDSKLSKFKDLGVNVLKRKNDNPYIINLFVFDEYFKQWDYVVYMDCDFMIFKDLNIFLENHDLQYDGIMADKEPFKIHEYFCQGWENDLKNKSLKDLRLEYDIDQFGFNAGFFSFNTKIINDNTLSNLFELDKKIKSINNHTHPTGSDQPIFNLYFNKKTNYIKDNNICFWKLIDDRTIASHFCRWDAPWVNNQHSPLFNMTYVEKYKENLEIFNAG